MALKHLPLIKRTFIFILSLSVAWWLIKTGLLHSLLATILPIRFLADFLTGLFYTSFLTSPIAVVMLFVISESGGNPIITAIVAGFGAMLGDLLIVKLFREKLARDVNVITHELQLQRVTKLLQMLKLEFIVPLFGAIIIASPFPDEVGLMMLGASKLKYQEIMVLTYVLNTAGILFLLLPISLAANIF